jgi:hypothetical protein
VTDPISKLRTATRRAKSDVANKLVSMCLHEMSRRISQNWTFKVDGEEYEKLVRERFNNQCPYCSRDLTISESVIEHLDGMNRYRAGLHVPGQRVGGMQKMQQRKTSRRFIENTLACTVRVGVFLISRRYSLRCALPHVSVLGGYLGGSNRTKTPIEREPAESSFLSQRILRIPAGSPVPHGDAASVADEALH